MSLGIGVVQKLYGQVANPAVLFVIREARTESTNSGVDIAIVSKQLANPFMKVGECVARQPVTNATAHGRHERAQAFERFEVEVLDCTTSASAC